MVKKGPNPVYVVVEWPLKYTRFHFNVSKTLNSTSLITYLVLKSAPLFALRLLLMSIFSFRCCHNVQGPF